ncbi:MAG: hypothetical protein V2G48_00070 [bacterium JZ-2024 1]
MPVEVGDLVYLAVISLIILIASRIMRVLVKVGIWLFILFLLLLGAILLFYWIS